MKTKGTSTWEQYIEHAALLVAIALLGWFAWGAFGTKIEHKQGKVVVHSGNVFEKLEEKAEALDKKINSSESPITINTPEALQEKFTEQRLQNTYPKDRIFFPSINMTAELDADQEVQSELREYVSPVIPEPKNMRTRQWFGTITDSEVSNTEGLRELFEESPHDTTWVQVAATISIDGIIESYSATDEYSAIPQQWYDSAIDIFDIVIERQTKINGNWGTPEVMEALLNHLSYREQLSEPMNTIGRDIITRELRSGKQEAVINPEFFALKGFKPKDAKTPNVWFAEEVEIDETPLQVLQNKLKDIDEEIEEQEAKIEKLNQDIRDANKGGGMGGMGGGSKGGNDKKVERLRKKLDKAQLKLDELNEEKNAVEQEIEDLEVVDSAGEADSVLSGEVWIWGHDMNVEPSATYRYRMKVQVANPFFGHRPSLYPQQQELSLPIVNTSLISEWSEPIEVLESKQWFVKRANPGYSLQSREVIDRAYASIEVFNFTDGQLTEKSRDIYVGQPIAVEGIEGNLGWFVLDILEDVTGEVVVLQNIQTGAIESRRAEDDLQDSTYLQLVKQMRDQTTSVVEDDEEDGGKDAPPTGPPGGGMGGGMGGGNR